MPTRAKAKRIQWSKTPIDDILQAQAHEEIAKRAQLVKGDELFEIDTEGHSSKGIEKRIRTLKTGTDKTPAQLEKLNQKARARAATLEAQARERKVENDPFDLWSSCTSNSIEFIASEAEHSTKKRRVVTTPFPNIPAVVPADAGQSVNPSTEDWKRVLLESAARARPERSEREVLISTEMPMTGVLLSVFPDDEIHKLTAYQQLRLFVILRESKDIPENPLAFLERVIPTLGSENNKEELIVKEEDWSFVRTNLPLSSRATHFVGKTTVQRNKQKRREEHEKLHQKKQEVKEFRSQFDELDKMKTAAELEVAQHQCRKKLRELERGALESVQEAGENAQFIYGKVRKEYI